MKRSEARATIDKVVEQFRSLAAGTEAGTLIGSEEALIAMLGCSRSTVRQVARLLEREGLLKVRRGINGGYFAARPEAGTVEATVAAYLATLDMDPNDVTRLASALWIEAMRKAAGADKAQARAMADRLRPKLLAIKDNTPFDTVRDLELETQAAIFQLANSSYIKLIFDINVAFSRHKFGGPAADDDTPEHAEFVGQWREAKLLELSAILTGDRDLAESVSRHSRKLWHRRLRQRYRVLDTF